MASGATVPLDGDNSKLNAKADESKKKVMAIGIEGGKSMTSGFDAGALALGKMVAAAYALKKVMETVASYEHRVQDIKVNASEKYSGGKLRAEIAGAKAGLSSQFVDNYLKGKGKSSYEERIAAVESFGNDPLSKYLKPGHIEEALNLQKTGFADADEVKQAARIGPQYLSKLVEQRKGRLSKDAQAEYNTESVISGAGARATPWGSTGRALREVGAYGEVSRRTNPEGYSAREAISTEGAHLYEMKEGEKYRDMQQAMDKSLEKNRHAEKTPNYTPGH